MTPEELYLLTYPDEIYPLLRALTFEQARRADVERVWDALIRAESAKFGSLQSGISVYAELRERQPEKFVEMMRKYYLTPAGQAAALPSFRGLSSAPEYERKTPTIPSFPEYESLDLVETRVYSLDRILDLYVRNDPDVMNFVASLLYFDPLHEARGAPNVQVGRSQTLSGFESEVNLQVLRHFAGKALHAKFSLPAYLRVLDRTGDQRLGWTNEEKVLLTPFSESEVNLGSNSQKLDRRPTNEVGRMMMEIRDRVRENKLAADKDGGTGKDGTDQYTLDPFNPNDLFSKRYLEIRLETYVQLLKTAKQFAERFGVSLPENSEGGLTQDVADQIVSTLFGIDVYSPPPRHHRVSRRVPRLSSLEE